jgi:ferredoxin-NADP reductase
MSSSPDTGEAFTTTVKRVPGGAMSNWMNDNLAPGDAIEVMRPTGLFVLRDRDAPIVAFAGGSGITPVISIVKSALRTTRRTVRLVDANRAPDAIIFAREIEQLRAAHPDRLDVHHHLDTDGGFLDAARCAGLAHESVNSDFYVCGPRAYMDTVEAGLAMLGVGTDQVFVERFFEPDDASTEAPSLTASSVIESLVIRLERRKHEIAYQPGDTILEAARRAGLRPPFSCEAGNCATCMAHLDQGAATLRTNNALSPAELDDGWILTCQALPTSTEIVVNYDA